MVMVRSVLPPSRSSQLEIRIMAPDIWRISAILVPPLPMMQPIRSFETVISCCCCWARFAGFAVRSCDPARAAKAAGAEPRLDWKSVWHLAAEALNSPVWLMPPVLAGFIPARPKAARLASGFLATCSQSGTKVRNGLDWIRCRVLLLRWGLRGFVG